METLLYRSSVLRLTNSIMRFFDRQDLITYYNIQANLHLKAISRFFRSSSYFVGISETSAFAGYLDMVMPVISENFLTNLLTCRLIVFCKYEGDIIIGEDSTNLYGLIAC